MKDSFFIKDLTLSTVLLKNDARFLWIILVPRRENISEIYELSSHDQQQLMREITNLSEILHRMSGAHKMNVAAIGNKVRDLHIHIVARFAHDVCWPEPIWGRGTSEPYEEERAQALVEQIQSALEKRVTKVLEAK